MAEKLISLKKAAENSGYHPDYLGYLIRKGKLEGKKIGRNWFTTEKAVKDFLATQKFLPLKNFLFSLVKSKFIFILLAVVIFIGAIFFLFHNPSVSYQRLSGDFIERTESAASRLTEEKIIREVKITSYAPDNPEETEIAARLELEPLEPEEKPSFFQQIINLFKNEKK